MLDEKGFDLWADGYDRDVARSDEERTYPFAGYRQVLSGICRLVMQGAHESVLDVGFGTAVLTEKLYTLGCGIWGQDLSGRMVEIAAAKMSGAHLFRGDIAEGLAAPLLTQRYDCIVATYSLHHLTDAQKEAFLPVLLPLLKPGGRLLIGDVAFSDRAALESCREKAGEEWDEEESYFVFEELREKFPSLTFTQVSFCAGILTLTK